MIWTVAILVPLTPFSYLQPIMIGGGPGTWFLLGYILFSTIGVGGFVGISTLAFVIEIHERRRLNYRVMLTGLVMLYGGILLACLLLALAGAIGGYFLTIQHYTANAAQDILSLFVNPITTVSSVAVVGTGLVIYAMVTAKATKA